MKLQLDEGCYGPTISINDAERDPNSEELKAILAKLESEIAQGHVPLLSVLDLIEPDEDEWDDHECGQCGTTGRTRTWNFE